MLVTNSTDVVQETQLRYKRQVTCKRYYLGSTGLSPSYNTYDGSGSFIREDYALCSSRVCLGTVVPPRYLS